jgi:alkanesulfonate monooxygenase SsuD/methylene tetrahydromethanopterin reductase-like flavin-dependent oxidoreductase (luciferase family)
MEVGVYTFGDLTPHPATGRTISPEQRYAEILAAARLADEAGLAVFGIGEHHRLDLPISSPAVVMAAIAARTKRIRVTSAVTILSTLDPVRVFQDFSTVDLVSNGRAEIIVGRGAFVESFPLFGHDLADYDALFAEKLELLLKLNASARVSWSGRFRPPLQDAAISPRPPRGKLPIWAGTGGNPESAANAARLGLPLTLANISLPPKNLAAQVEDYRRIGVEAGHDPAQLRVTLAGHMHIEEDSRSARENFYPYYAAYFRHHAPKTTYASEVPREVYQTRAAADGPLFVGSPQEIVDKILWERELFGHQRYLAQVDIGGLAYSSVARTIELLGEKVLPALRQGAQSNGLS